MGAGWDFVKAEGLGQNPRDKICDKLPWSSRQRAHATRGENPFDKETQTLKIESQTGALQGSDR